MILTEAVLIAAFNAYSKTIDLIMSVRADIPEDRRKSDWEKHYERMGAVSNVLEGWIKAMQKQQP